MKPPAIAMVTAALVVGALATQPVAAVETVSGLLVFDGTLGDAVEVPIGAPASPVFLKGFEFSGLATVELPDHGVVFKGGTDRASIVVLGNTEPANHGSTRPGETVGPSDPIIVFAVAVPTIGELTFVCSVRGTGLDVAGGCLIDGYGPTAKGSVTATIGNKAGDPLQAGDPLKFLISFDLLCGLKDNPCPTPPDQEPASGLSSAQLLGSNPQLVLEPLFDGDTVGC